MCLGRVGGEHIETRVRREAVTARAFGQLCKSLMSGSVQFQEVKPPGQAWGHYLWSGLVFTLGVLCEFEDISLFLHILILCLISVDSTV